MCPQNGSFLSLVGFLSDAFCFSYPSKDACLDSISLMRTLMVPQGWRRSLRDLIQVFSAVHVLDFGLLPFQLDHHGNLCGRAEERGKPSISTCAPSNLKAAKSLIPLPWSWFRLVSVILSIRSLAYQGRVAAGLSLF